MGYSVSFLGCIILPNRLCNFVHDGKPPRDMSDDVKSTLDRYINYDRISYNIILEHEYIMGGRLGFTRNCLQPVNYTGIATSTRCIRYQTMNREYMNQTSRKVIFYKCDMGSGMTNEACNFVNSFDSAL